MRNMIVIRTPPGENNDDGAADADNGEVYTGTKEKEDQKRHPNQ